ncbi:MAG: hypothetical protein WDW38_009891 [Sanguina aurantia]
MASSGPPREVLRWILGLDLSYTVKNIRRDFANGFLFAEILSRYYPSDIAMHSYDNVASVERKKKNWALLGRFFKKNNVAVDQSQVEAAMMGEGEAACEVLTAIHDLITSSGTPTDLTSRDLINQQHTASDSLSAGFSSGGLMSNLAANVLGNLNGGAGMPKDNDETSQTKSVISPATVTITGTGDATTDQKSQANADTLTERDASTANATLANTLTLQQAQELQAQQKKAQENQRAADLAGAALNGMVGDIAKSFKFAEGSPQKIAMHGIVGLIQAKLGNTSIAGGMIAGMVVRLKQYAAAIKEENMKKVAPSRKVQPREPSARDKALIFARNVPKPEVRAKAVSSNGAAALGRESDGGDASLPAESDLDVMERQHQADLQRVDAIRAQLGRQLRV